MKTEQLNDSEMYAIRVAKENGCNKVAVRRRERGLRKYLLEIGVKQYLYISDGYISIMDYCYSVAWACEFGNAKEEDLRWALILGMCMTFYTYTHRDIVVVSDNGERGGTGTRYRIYSVGK